MTTKISHKIKQRRVIRVRAAIKGTAERPRLTVFRSNRFMYAQLVNDMDHRTLASVSTAPSKTNKPAAAKKADSARAAGEALAKKAMELGIKEAVFDRGSYRYHGRVKAIADGARAGGLKF